MDGFMHRIQKPETYFQVMIDKCLFYVIPWLPTSKQMSEMCLNSNKQQQNKEQNAKNNPAEQEHWYKHRINKTLATQIACYGYEWFAR